MSNLVTEDDQPVDNFFQDKQANLLSDALDASWNHRPFLSAADVAIFYHVGQDPIVPDVLLATDVDPPADPLDKEQRSYYTWLFGKPPDVVIEIVSNRKGGEDSAKLLKYAAIRVPYYVIYDPGQLLSTRPIRVYMLNGTQYVERVDRYFADLDLGLCQWEGVYDGLEDTWLRWTDRQGTPLLTGLERAKEAEARAKEAEGRAQEAEAAAKEERALRLALEERLRRLEGQ